jgi:putative phosphoribosyl transferase
LRSVRDSIKGEAMDAAIFENRSDAGKRLAAELSSFKNDPAVIVVALPRGGVPVAFEVAATLKAPLDVFLVRKLGVPNYSELAMGAIASGGYGYLDEDRIRQMGVRENDLKEVVARETRELERREQLYRAGQSPLNLTEKIVILVDDGLATGASMLSAIRAVRNQRPRKIIVAVPVASTASLQKLSPEVDKIICVEASDNFCAVGLWYTDFRQTTDEEVIHLLPLARFL